MKYITHRGWIVVQSCIVNCDLCGRSNVDAAAGTPAECVKSAREDGWQLIDGKIVCNYCFDAAVLRDKGKNP